jgi:CheY-like chemotaxis protein
MDNWFETLVAPFVLLATVALAFALAYAFRHPLRALLESLGISRLRLLGIDVELSIAQAVEAYEKRGLGPPSADDRRRIREAVELLAPLARGRRVLWVDDDPPNNAYERAAFLDWRIDVQTRRSTDDAVDELKAAALEGEPYPLVISDWTRDEKPEGLRLAERLRDKESDVPIDVPIAFYFGRVPLDELDRRRSAAAQVGAIVATGSPGELYRAVLFELARPRLDA